MRDIVWSSILSVGFDEIDDDHRKLVGIFNELNHAVTANASREYLAATLEELINCTIWHFSHEERLMLKHGYDGIAAHREEHRELVENARDMQRALLAAGGAVAEAQIVYLERWLTAHILTTDQRLGAFLSQAV